MSRARAHLLAAKLVEVQQASSRQRQRGASASASDALLLQPTALGRLVDTLPLDVEASNLVLLGALSGLVWRHHAPIPMPACRFLLLLSLCGD